MSVVSSHILQENDVTQAFRTRFPSAIVLPPTSAKTGYGVRSSLVEIAQHVHRRMTHITAGELMFLLDLLAPAAPSKLSRLPLDLKLLVRTLKHQNRFAHMSALMLCVHSVVSVLLWGRLIRSHLC